MSCRRSSTDPRDICSLFSSEGPLAFFEKILGDRVPIVRAAIDYSDDQIRDAMYTGVRLAQDLCYCRDWGEYKAMKLKPDPFSRDLKKVAKRLQAEPMTATAAPVDDYEGEPDFDDEYISESDFQEAFATVAATAPASLSQAMNAAMQQQPSYSTFDLPAWSTTDG
jgi:hypothetical protein